MDDAPKSSARDYHLLGIFALALLLYANTFGHHWALDDAIVYTSNRFVKQGVDGIPDIMTQDTFAGFLENQSTLSGGRYRPLSVVTFAVEYEMWKSNPKLSHIINVALYGLTGLLLYLLIVRLLGEERRTMAFFTTLLFIAHPLHTEVVANVKSRDEIMCFLFLIAAGHCLITYLEESGAWRLVAATASFGLALLSKESAITFLAIYPVALFTFCGQSVRRSAQIILPFAVLALVYVILRGEFAGELGDRGTTSLMTDPLIHATSGERYATIFMSLGKYIKLLLLPHPLVYDYSYNQIPLVTWKAASAWIPLLIHVGLAAIVVYGVRKRCSITFVILFYLATISIYCNLVFPIGAILAERFLYLPSLAFCAVLGTLLAGATRPALPRGLGVVALGLILFAYSAKTISRNRAWKDNWTLVNTDIKNAMNSARAHYSLGEQAMRRFKAGGEQETALLDMAEGEFRAALDINPDGMVHNWLGDVLIKKGRREEAKVQFEAAAKLQGNYYGVHVNRGNVFFESGQLTPALEAYKRAHELDPVKADVHRMICYLLVETKRYEEALPYIQYTLDREPTFVDAHVQAAQAMLGLGRPELALTSVENALKLDAEFAKAYVVRAQIEHRLERPEDAIASYERGLAIEPDATSHVDLGVLLHRQQRRDEARTQFEAAVELDPGNYLARINLGAMSLEAGKPEETLPHYEALVEHHPTNNDARVRCANLLTELGRREDAIALLDVGIENQPASVLLHFHAGVQRSGAGDIEKAREHYETAVANMPSYAPAQINLGSIYLAAGEAEKAAGHFRLAIDRQPDNPRAHNNLGNALSRDEATHEEALAAYRKAIELDPEYGSPHYNASLIYLQQQAWDKCLLHLEQAAVLIPNNPNIIQRLQAVRQKVAEDQAQPTPPEQ